MEKAKLLALKLNELRASKSGNFYKDELPKLLDFMPYRSCSNFAIQLVRNKILYEYREGRRKYYRFPKEPIYYKNVEVYLKKQSEYFNKSSNHFNKEEQAIEYLKKLGYLIFKQM